MRRESRRNCWSIISLIVYFLMITVECVNVTQSNGKLIPFLDNLKASMKCACKHPQPRLIHIGKI